MFPVYDSNAAHPATGVKDKRDKKMKTNWYRQNPIKIRSLALSHSVCSDVKDIVSYRGEHYTGVVLYSCRPSRPDSATK
ncbi:hypothetical protein CP532_1702 [Ophiocordyceps camponoti-leonardi (nom. inval.)]|nr:hypothetical protein CP532_1702 [Ophiocordyceps camponoti-leonardi (nom. inval.)]